MRLGGVIAVNRSGNEKLGITSATYRPIKYSCGECPLKAKLCYAKYGWVGRWNRELENAGPFTIAELAHNEATLIAKLNGRLPLRLHVSGDCLSNEDAATLASAAAGYTRKFGQQVWTYTHQWHIIDKAAWGTINASASCDNWSQTQLAKDRGYVPAIMVPGRLGRGIHQINGHRVVQCPQQLGLTNCANCKGLCQQTDNMAKHDLVLAFALHGPGAPHS